MTTPKHHERNHMSSTEAALATTLQKTIRDYLRAKRAYNRDCNRRRLPRGQEDAKRLRLAAANDAARKAYIAAYESAQKFLARSAKKE